MVCWTTRNCLCATTEMSTTGHKWNVLRRHDEQKLRHLQATVTFSTLGGILQSCERYTVLCTVRNDRKVQPP